MRCKVAGRLDGVSEEKAGSVVNGRLVIYMSVPRNIMLASGVLITRLGKSDSQYLDVQCYSANTECYKGVR